MMRIVTDCAADLLPEEVAQLQISVLPLFIQFPEGEVDATTLSPDDFYRRLAAMWPDIPTTAQPSAGIVAQLYRPFIEAGDDILSIHISSGLSGTINSARLAAQEFPAGRIEIVDSLTLSGGQRYQVLAAARGLQAGWSRERIVAHLDQVRDATETVFTLETLTYLAKGGRIGRVQALAGSLLHIKPIIHVHKGDGKYDSAGKARTMPRCLDKIADHLVRVYGTETPLRVSVMHGQFQEQAEALADLLRSRVNVGKLEIIRISPVLGVHTGPGVVGAAAVPLHLMEDIK